MISFGVHFLPIKGQHVGRSADDPAKLIARYPEIVEAVRTGASLRIAAAQTGAAINTVRRVKAALEDEL